MSEALNEQYSEFDHPARLDVLENAKGVRFWKRLQMLPIRVIGGSYPGPFVVILYGGDLLGKWFAPFLQRAMRGSAYWSKQELELFAAFTANQLGCDY